MWITQLGSETVSNHVKMSALIMILKKEGFKYVDSDRENGLGCFTDCLHHHSLGLSLISNTEVVVCQRQTHVLSLTFLTNKQVTCCLNNGTNKSSL